MENFIKRFKKKLSDKIFLANILTYLSFFIIFVTTLFINVFVAFYLLAAMLLVPVALIILGRR